MTSNWHCGTERVWFVRLVDPWLGNILLEYGEQENCHTKIGPAQKWLPRPSLAAKNGCQKMVAKNGPLLPKVVLADTYSMFTEVRIGKQDHL